jgi:hypothetical protein
MSHDRRSAEVMAVEHRVAWDEGKFTEKVRVAVANLRVRETEILSNLDGRPIRSIERFKRLNHLLNDICRHGCDLAVLPEVSVPNDWLQWIVWVAAKRRLGIVCGLEHVIHDNTALNYVLTVLPFASKGRYQSCYVWPRLKRYYAPMEIDEVKGRFLRVPSGDKQPYDLFKWRGLSFTVFNCFELTNLQERGWFTGHIDLLVCSEYNPDVNYFSNIVESASRDLHCYIVQSNDSEHGDSRIVAPCKTEQMNLVQVRGGENETFLVATLDIASLRDHQTKSTTWQLRKDRKFKPTPAGWNPQFVRRRSKQIERKV